MANTLLGQTAYSFWTDPNVQNPQYTTYTTGVYNTPAYYITSPTEAEKAGKALAIMKELQADGLINIDSVEKFCEMIDKIASKI